MKKIHSIPGSGTIVLLGLLGTTLSGTQTLGQVVRSATGANAAAIQATVNQFRVDLGANNGVGPSATPGVGRREINWDAVPDSFASGGANAFPGNFFDLPKGSPAGRIRGARFVSSGGFEVSADSDSNNDGTSGPVAPLFGNHTPDNADDFAAFSPERIFGLNGTSEMDVFFDVPGSPGDAAAVRGFGAVFTDVEVAGITKLDFYDLNNALLGSYDVPAFSFTGSDSFDSFSFVGVSFNSPVVRRVHIKNGDFDLSLNSFGGHDATAMDDFIYGEPKSVQSIPDASNGFALLSASLAGLHFLRRYQRG